MGVYDNKIRAKNNTGGIIFAGYKNMEDIEDICILNNDVSVKDGSLNTRYGISIRAYQPGDRFEVTSYWSKEKEIVPFTIKGRRVKISDNKVSGGYYGIALLNVDKSSIIENHISNNIRNLRVGHNSNELLIDKNIGLNSLSTSILFGYVSNKNIITRNKLTTNRASSWGMIEATVGFDNNIIGFNKLFSPSKKPSHHYAIYFGVHANNNLVFSNSINGYFSKAHISLEASQSKHPNTIHRSGAGGYLWESSDSEGNEIIANVFDVLNKSVPLIFLSQTSVYLKNTDILCNKNKSENNNLIERLEVSDNGTSSGDQNLAFE